MRRRRPVFASLPAAIALACGLVAAAPLWLAAPVLTAAPAAVPEAAPVPAVVRAVADVGMTVGDLDRSVAFFTQVLGFEEVARREAGGAAFARLEGVPGARARAARLQLGRETIELTQYLEPEGRPYPADARSNDRTFQHVAIIVSDMDAAYRRLRERRVTHISSGPQTLPDWNLAAAGIRAFYFKDPDGHPLEILQFPAGKGAARWQRRDALFLGIDHTAIVVADTGRSLAFYGAALGLKVAGESENHGAEQERLNAVFGARLRITALRAEDGPGIELLEYLAPADGRPAPEDTRSNDRIHWQTRLVASDPDAAVASALRAGGRRVSETLVRDPDGHAMLFTRGGE